MKFVVLIVVAVLTLTGCASAVSLAFTAPGLVGVALLPEEPEVIEVADAGTGPGSVIYAETLPNLPITATRGGMNSARVVYRSVDDSEVSGTVFTPGGMRPRVVGRSSLSATVRRGSFRRAVRRCPERCWGRPISLPGSRRPATR